MRGVKSLSWIYVILGGLFEINYVFGALGLEVKGISLIYWLVLACLFFINYQTVSFHTNILLAVLAWSVIYMISYFLFPKTDYSTYKFFMFMGKVPVLLLIPSFITDYKSFFKGALCTLLLFITITFFKAIPMITEVSINNRLELGLLNPIWISRAIFEALLISMLILRNRKIVNIFIFLLCLPLAYVSGSKGPIVAFFFVMAIYALSSPHYKIYKRAFMLIIVCILTAAFFYVKHSVSNNQVNAFIVQRFLSVTPDAASEGIKAESRTVVWPTSAAKFITSDPFHILFGYGVGNFSRFYFDGSDDTRFYPHNIFLELLVENGIILFLIILCMVWLLYKNSDTKFNYIFLYYLVNACLSGDIILNEMLFFYMGFLSIGTRQLENIKRQGIA